MIDVLYIKHMVYLDEPEQTPPPSPEEPTVKIEGFTPEQQEIINKIVADTRKEATTKLQKTVEELETFKQKANLTGQSAKELEQQIEKIRNESLTKEELLRKEQAKLANKHKTEVDELVKERNNWRDRYTSQVINTSLQQAAIKHNAFNPSQIIDLLSAKSTIEFETDKDGNQTDNLVVKVAVKTKDSKGADVVLSTSPEDAVKVLSESDDYFNLFKDKSISGLQRRQNENATQIDEVKLIRNDTAAFIEARRAGKIKK